MQKTDSGAGFTTLVAQSATLAPSHEEILDRAADRSVQESGRAGATSQ
jgi:hypothetical protein